MNQIKAQLTPQFLQGVMAETKQTWRKCQRKNYDVYATIMPAGVMFANRLEQPEVYKQLINCYGTPVITPDKKPSSIDPKSLYTVQEGQVVLCGTRGELWTVKAEKFLKSYTTQYTDNKTLEKKLKQGWVVASRAGEDKPQAVGICIPAKYLVQVQLSWATLYMNDPRSGGHGVGDILVCACDAQGNPMLNSSDNFSPTNNEVFSCTYDLGVGGWTKAGYVKLAQDLSTQIDLDWVKKNIPIPKTATSNSERGTLDDICGRYGAPLNVRNFEDFYETLDKKHISPEAYFERIIFNQRSKGMTTTEAELLTQIYTATTADSLLPAMMKFFHIQSGFRNGKQEYVMPDNGYICHADALDGLPLDWKIAGSQIRADELLLTTYIFERLAKKEQAYYVTCYDDIKDMPLAQDAYHCQLPVTLELFRVYQSSLGSTHVNRGENNYFVRSDNTVFQTAKKNLLDPVLESPEDIEFCERLYNMGRTTQDMCKDTQVQAIITGKAPKFPAQTTTNIDTDKHQQRRTGIMCKIFAYFQKTYTNLQLLPDINQVKQETERVGVHMGNTVSWMFNAEDNNDRMYFFKGIVVKDSDEGYFSNFITTDSFRQICPNFADFMSKHGADFAHDIFAYARFMGRITDKADYIPSVRIQTVVTGKAPHIQSVTQENCSVDEHYKRIEGISDELIGYFNGKYNAETDTNKSKAELDKLGTEMGNTVSWFMYADDEDDKVCFITKVVKKNSHLSNLFELDSFKKACPNFEKFLEDHADIFIDDFDGISEIYSNLTAQSDNTLPTKADESDSKTDLTSLSGYFFTNPSRDKFMQDLLDKDIPEPLKDRIFTNKEYKLNYLWYIAVNSGKYKGNLIMSYLLDVKGWVSVYQRVELDELKSWLTKILPESELQTVNTYWNNIETDGMGEDNWQMSRYISFVGDSEYAAGIIALLYKMHTSQAIQDIDRVLQSYTKQYKSDIAEYGYTNLINVLVKKGINPADVGIKDTRVFEQLIKDHSDTPELAILINPYIEANCDDSVYERKLKTAMFKVMDSSHVNYVSAFRAVNICMKSLPVSTTKLILKYFMYCHKEIPSGMGFWAYVEDALDNNNIQDTKALLRAAQISPDVLNQLTTELNQRHQLNTSLNQFIHDLQSQYSWYKAQNIKHL